VCTWFRVCAFDCFIAACCKIKNIVDALVELLSTNQQLILHVYYTPLNLFKDLYPFYCKRIMEGSLFVLFSSPYLHLKHEQP